MHLSSGLSAVKSVHLLPLIRAEPSASNWKLKGHSVVFGQEIQTWNLNIGNVNEVIIQTLENGGKSRGK